MFCLWKMIGIYPIQCCPNGHAHIKASFFFNLLKDFSKKILFLDNNLEILVPFLSLENNAENNF